jgi:RecB family exonuclease
MHESKEQTEELEGLCNSDYFYRMMSGRDHWNGTSRNHRNELVAWSHVSASQIESYVKCHRYWHFKSILKVPEAQTGRQALGESYHLVMEKVPKGLEWPNHADTSATPEEWQKAEALAKISLPLLPPEPAHIPIKREWQIKLDTYENGPTFIGYVDLALPPGLGWPSFLIPANEAIIGDYKTTSDFRYMKTPEELENSVQMMSYAKWAIQEWPSGLVGQDQPTPELVRLLHIYARTKPPFNRQSIRHESAVVTKDQINIFWDKTLDIIREMQQTATCTSSDDVEANGALTGHCEAYGGCSFRDKCGISKDSTIKTLFSINTKKDPNMSNILAKIQAARAAQSSNSLPTQASDQPVQPAESKPVEANPQGPLQSPKEEPAVKPSGPIHGVMRKIESMNKGWPTLGGALASSYAKERGISVPGTGVIPGTGEMSANTVVSLGELMKLAETVPVKLDTGVVPPDAPPREQPIITRPGDTVTESTEESEDDEESEISSTVSVSVESVGAGIPENTPKKRGRPSKADLAARAGQTVAADGGDSMLNAENQRLKKENEELQSANNFLTKALESRAVAKDGCTLYVDCFPMRGESEVTDFFTWIQPIAQTVAESNGVKDWRLIDYKGKGLLATHIRELVRAEGLPKAMTIQSYAGGADVALEILTPLAKRIIRKLS